MDNSNNINNNDLPTSRVRSEGRPRPPPRPPRPPPPMLWKMDPRMMAVQQASMTSFHPEFAFCGTCSVPSSDANKDNSGLELTENGKYFAKKKGSSKKFKDEIDDIETSSCSESDASSSDGNSDNDSAGDDESNKYKQTKLLLAEPLSCASHVLLIKSLIRPIAGVRKVSVSLDKSEVTIIHDAQIQDDRLTTVLSKGGYPTTAIETIVSNSSSTSVVGDALTEATTNSREAGFTNVAAPAADSSKVRSQFQVKGICCPTEVPIVRKIIRGIPGADKIQINIATKMVYIFHDSSIVSAKKLAESLTYEGFPSKIIKDGGMNVAGAAASSAGDSNNTAVGRTTLRIMGALRHKDVSSIQHEIAATFPGAVKWIGVNITESVVHIDHDVTKVVAEQLIEPCSSVLPNDYQISLEKDGQNELRNRQSELFAPTAKSQYVESTIFISNLSCSQHSKLFQKVIKKSTTRSQTRATYPHLTSQTVKVEHNPDLLPIFDLIEILQQNGFDASVVTDGEVEQLYLPLKEDPIDVNGKQQQNSSNALGDASSDDNGDNLLRQLLSIQNLRVLLSGIFWFMSMLSAIGGVWQYLEYAGLFSVFFGLPPVARKAWRTLRRLQFDANCMMVTAAIGALALQEYDEAASVAFLFAVSELLEERSTLKARKALEAIVNLRPDHASLIHPVSKQIVVVPAESIPVGSLLSVRTGDKIAADGIVVEGSSTVDESSLTGESVPILKKVDDSVSGGSINIGTSQLIVKTTTTAEDSAVSRLIQVVEESQSNRSPTEKLVDSFARSYTPLVISVAAIMCTIPWFFGSDVGHSWTLNGLIIIVIACPCALTISTPVTYAAGLAATAQRGVIVKGGARLEALGAVDKILFDKTGTLTQGKFSLSDLVHIGKTRSRKEMLELLALMEAPSSHPLSATLVQAAKSEGVAVPANRMNLTQHTILQGEGVTANVDGKKVYVGNQRLFDRIGMHERLPQHCKDLAEQWNGKGGTVGFLGVEGEGICGSFCLIDAIRPEAKEVIDSFHSMGVQVMMLTGDNDGSAKAVAKEIGLLESSVHSQLLPEDKLHFVGSLIRPSEGVSRSNFSDILLSRCCADGNSTLSFSQSRSLVLFCGDGVNDGPALSVADIGVSMGGESAATLAMEMSDVTLMDSNLSKLLYVIKMGTRVVHTIQENILFSLMAKALVVLLTFLGKMTLFGAIASDVGVMLIVTLNGMKLLPSSSSPSTITENGASGELLERKKDSGILLIRDTDGNSFCGKVLCSMKRRLISSDNKVTSLLYYDEIDGVSTDDDSGDCTII